MMKSAVIFFAIVIFFAVVRLMPVIAVLFTMARTGGHRIVTEPWSAEPPSLGLVFVAAVVAALSAWREEGPSSRAYHFAMPVARGPHTVVRLFAGWGWLLVGVLALCVVGNGVDAVVAHMIGQPWIAPGVQPWHWVVPFVAASTTYFLAAIVVTASDHPLAWIGGLMVTGFVGYGILQGVVMFGSARGSAAARAVLSLLIGEYGVLVPAFGKIVPILGHPAAEHSAMNVNLALNLNGTRFMPFDVWLRASAIWLLGGMAGAWLVAHKYRKV